MKRLLFAVVFCISVSAALYSQDESNANDEQKPVTAQVNWKTSGILIWAYNQTAVSKNWTGKESFSRMWQAKLFLSAERDSYKSNWLITFKEEYGESETKKNSEISIDHFEFNAVYTYKIYKLLQPYVSFYVQSQNNKFMDPVSYIESAGFNFTVFSNNINALKLRAGVALKQIDDSINGNKRNSGAEVVANYDLLFHKDAKFVSEARIYETFKDGEDFRWENKLFLKTGPWFTTEFGYKVYFENARITAHSWTEDIETLIYVALGFSFNIFRN
ncbi:MAG: DUF481 domain-containing protein [Endomicrobium sp.]|nr:DUF481 domain-containing protein [Endomicrobium sp.]